MKHLWLALTLALATFAGAQQASRTSAQVSAKLPRSFPELVAVLPSLVHNKQLQFGPYSDATWAALQNDPASAAAAVPIMSRNLHDPDQDVQYYTLAILQGLALVRRDYAELVSPLSGQMANAISTGTEKTRLMALLAVEQFHQKAPEVVIPPIEKLLDSKPNSERLMIGAAETLMITRPSDDKTQDEVLAAMNDPSVPSNVRLGLIHAASVYGVGPKIQDYVVQLVNTSADRSWRDAAIAGAERIGSSALSRISDVLKRIAHDQTESSESRDLALHALNTLFVSAR